MPEDHGPSTPARSRATAERGRLRRVFDAVTNVLATEPRIQHALVFGSVARGDARADSDLDVAIGGLTAPMSALELGDLIGRLEEATGRAVDLVVLDDAGPGLAFRIVRDGVVVLDRTPTDFAHRRAEIALAYHDWQPIEDLFSAARRGNGA